MFLVAQRGGGEQGAAWPGRGDGEVVVTGCQSVQNLLGGSEGGAQGEPLSALAGQPGEGGKGPFGGELGWPGEVQGS